VQKTSLTTGELLIAKDLSIAGPGAGTIAVSGNGASGVFDVSATSTVAIAGLTVTGGMNFDGGGVHNLGTLALTGDAVNGNTGGWGGGIRNDGTLTVADSSINTNTAFAQSGGGIANFGTLALDNSTVSDNSTTYSYGGGISNGGTLTVTNSAVSHNHADFSSSSGGGILNTGTLTVTDSTLSGNSAGRDGGGIDSLSNLTVTGSTLSGNSAVNSDPTRCEGGGVDNTGTLALANSTLSGNSTFGVGGGIANGGTVERGRTVTLTSCTVSGNSAGVGGGVSNVGPQAVTTLQNTIAAGNTASVSSPDVVGALSSQGHNLIGDGTGGSGFTSTDLVGTSAHPIDPKLGPLQDNGGPTPTMALLPGSPALDAGDNAFAPGPYDQRGPGFPRIVNGTIDIGAFEAQAARLTVSCSVTTPVLWPPNHKLVNVGLSVQVSDPNATLEVHVFADDGARPSDAADFAPGSLRLRGERHGGGGGRVYLIVVKATDASGDVAFSTCTVVVPHDQSAASLAAVEQQAADAEAYYRASHTAPAGYVLLGSRPHAE
jgi:hypothetical protein